MDGVTIMPVPLNTSFLLVEGDSITHDQYDTDDEGAVNSIIAQAEYIADGKSLFISNEGVPGAYTIDLLNRAAATIEEYGADVSTILIQTGTNDILSGGYGGGAYSPASDVSGVYDQLRLDVAALINAYLSAGFTVIPVSFPCRQPDLVLPMYADGMGPWLENIYHPIYAELCPSWCSGGKPLINLYELSKTFDDSMFFDATHFTSAGNAAFRAATRAVIGPQLPDMPTQYAPVLANSSSSYILTDYMLPASVTASSDFSIELCVYRTVAGTRNLINAPNGAAIGMLTSGGGFGRIAGGGNSHWGASNIAMRDTRLRYTFEQEGVATDVRVKTYINGRLADDKIKTRGTSSVDALLKLGENGVAGGYFDGVIYAVQIKNLSTDEVIFSESLTSTDQNALPSGSASNITYQNVTSDANMQVMGCVYDHSLPPQIVDYGISVGGAYYPVESGTVNMSTAQSLSSLDDIKAQMIAGQAPESEYIYAQRVTLTPIYEES